jgi:uncharacterized protein
VVVYVGLDARTNRIIASSRLNRHVSRDTPAYREGQQVNLLIASETPQGYQAIVDNAHLGQLYNRQLASPLKIGARLKGFVRAVHASGKIDLNLDAAGYQRVEPLTKLIITALKMNGGRLAFDDESSLEAIRQHFGVSKKAFKQALGKLYKTRRITFANPGVELLDNSVWSPGRKSSQVE